MIVSRKKSFILVSVGKTGTTSLESVLAIYEDTFPVLTYKKHAPLSEIEEQLDLDQFYKFMFLRNPWDLVVSKYAFHRKAGKGTGYGGIPVNEGARNMLFDDWVRVPEFLYAQYEYPIKRMYEFGISRSGDRMLADKVYRFEELNEAYADICRVLSLPQTRLPQWFSRRLGSVPTMLPALNRSAHNHYRSYYDAETKAIVERFFAREIAIGGYRF